MPKPSVIRCVLDEQRKAQKRKAVYRVSIPAELSETGKRQNRYFTTQREGNAFAAQLRTEGVTKIWTEMKQETESRKNETQTQLRRRVQTQ